MATGVTEVNEPSLRGRELEKALEQEGLVPHDRISTAPMDRIAYARDAWPRTLIAIGYGTVAPHPPDIVVWPENTAEVAALVRFANRHRVPIVPYAAGSGVSGGALPIRGGIVLDLKRMNRMLELDKDNATATFECGMNGEHLEHELGRHGFTLGHFPSSIMCSTFGGWLAARSAGQLSTKYGKIEDMALAMEVVTGKGDVLLTGRPPYGPPGLDLTPVFIGSEGTLGIITKGTVRVWPAPEKRIFRGYEFARVGAGCEAIRKILQQGLMPSVVRLYDELDTVVHRMGGDKKAQAGDSQFEEHIKSIEWPANLERGARALKQALFQRVLANATPLKLGVINRALDAVVPRMGSGCLLIIGFEGDRELAEGEADIAHAQLLGAGGRDLGERPGLRWFEHRYKISWKQPRMFTNGAFVDTMEVATTWDRLHELYEGVLAATHPHAFVLAHFSHAYPEGCSIYFTFAAAGLDLHDAERRYDELWNSALTAVLKHGGSISHHHGVGLSKARFMTEEHKNLMRVYEALKSTFDPAGVMNPGKMGLAENRS